ncbi:protein kinase domain-containing protein [Adonisia turfae]|uniref:Protein kinase domain-containing protein n=1 Tax=Adonisia turfae CCMR0081 TaxID=2292702 RepID=A0A6M0RKV9_9CYAN|nr:WD40 repeat domain-containing serine/threonine-protein kinase [Adonisia turfae]NEZ56442.1 hypothetical protein [Adonisia turfae CCMR0081]
MVSQRTVNGKHRYEIIQSFGRGQSGQTDLAHVVAPESNPTAQRLLVVIKQIYRPQEPLDTLTKRMQAVGQHPQLPALVDSWQTSAGQFLAFEYIDAPAITQAEPPPWPAKKVEVWLLSLLAVLEYLHSFRLIHGDIRPDNIRQGQQPMLIDLRITKRLDRQQTPLNVTGGDAAYAAPEQALGQLVCASDLYSLGLIAIHLLTGLNPFDLYSVADNRWIWPDLVATPIPKNLSTVLHKLLARSLETRYATASQAISDLKKSSAVSLLDKARSLLLPIDTWSQPPQASKAPASSKSLTALSSPQLQWQFLYQFSTGITTALAIQGNILAMGTSSGSLLICDLPSGEEVYTLKGRRHRDRITALTFHPQQRILFSASSDGTVKLWDLNRGELVQTLQQPGWQPTDLAVAPPYLIISDGTGYIDLWDLAKLSPCHRFNQHQDWVSVIATNGKQLASISRDRTLRLWSLPEQRLLETIPIGPSRALALHPSGQHVIVGNDQGQVNVWHVANLAKPDRLCSADDGITALALSPDARLLAVGTDGNALRIYQGTNGQCVSELAQGWGVVAISFDGNTLVSSSQDETVTVWQRSNHSVT